MNQETIKKLQQLAKINLNPQEEKKLLNNLNSIISFIEKINQIDISNLPPIDPISQAVSINREDKIKTKKPSNEIVKKLAPNFQSGHIVVPAVIE